MDSDDDMLSHGNLSGDDGYYSGGTDDYNYDDDDDDEPEPGYAFHDDSTIIPSDRPQINYTVLKEEDIRRNQNDDIEQVSNILSITEVEASVLLLHYHWDVSKVHDQWFADEERVRTNVGILDGPGIQSGGGRLRCGICFESFRREKIVSVTCGHPFCSTCWTGYITTTINDGPGCLMLKCPEPSCRAAVGRDMIEKLVCGEDKEKYYRYFLRSYIEENKKMKWCPAPGCEHAIGVAAGTDSYDVMCLCSHSFCWNCTEEAHRPVDCDTVAQWILKNSAESENCIWILANSKPCPKCKKPIEKNQGCMHMTCAPPCKFEFCWLCLNTWSEHGERTGGYYACNRYETAKKSGLYDEDEKRREMAKHSLERYTHYYERWASNQKSRDKAMEDLQKMQSENLDKLSDTQWAPKSQLMFITDAWLQIVECRRVLKWTYAYGYYLPPHANKEFFEYLQGEAEEALEKLHGCAEKEIEVFINAEGPLDEFNNFRTRLSCMTCAMKTYFENLVKALENGFVGTVKGSSSTMKLTTK